MSQLFKNNVSSYLASELGMGVLEIDLVSGDGANFPSPTGSEFFLLTLHTPRYEQWEVVKVTSRSSDTLTISDRGFEGTQQIWASGTKVSINITAKTLESFRDSIAQNISDISDLEDAVEALESEGGGGESEGTLLTSMQWQITIPIADSDPNEIQYSYVVLDGDWMERYLDDGDEILPTLGFSPDEKNKVSVYRNGILQMWDGSDALDDSGGGYTQNQRCVQWKGHNALRFFPPLDYEEVIQVVGPRIPWYVDNTTDYADLYNDLGVINSFTMGGQNQVSSALEKWLRKYTWATGVMTVLSTSYDAFNSTREGSGAGGDETDYVYFFGGALTSGTSSRFEKHNFTTVSTTSLNETATRNGCTITDAVKAYIGGFGTSQSSDDEIYEFTYATDTLADLGITVVFSNTRYMNGMSNADFSKGVFVNRYSSGGSTSIGKFQMFTYATETLATEQSLSTSLDATCVTLSFNDNAAYICDEDNLKVFDFTTETETTQYTHNSDSWNENNVGQGMVMCDGLHYGQTEARCFFHSGTKPLWSMAKHRVLGDDGVYGDRRYFPIGSITDKWCK